VRLTAAAFGCAFSPFRYLSVTDDHAVWAALLVAAFVGLCALQWLVMRYEGETLWLAEGDGGVLVPAEALVGPAGEAAAGAHPDVVRAEVLLRVRGGALDARARIWARPLAQAEPIRGAVGAALRGEVARLTGRALAGVDVRVKVLTVSQLKRYLP